MIENKQKLAISIPYNESFMEALFSMTHKNKFVNKIVSLIYVLHKFIQNVTTLLYTGIAQSAQRLATDWTTEGSEFESRLGQEFSLLHVFQTGSVAHPASYPMDTGGSFLGVKLPGLETYHSPPASAEVNKLWIYTPTSTYAFIE
jgi:hypothetical protein